MRAIYRGLKQVFETLFSGKGSSFRQVGLVEFPSPGMWSIVLISQSPSDEVARSLPGQEEHISVFLPCAPNPTTGFFFYVPKSKIIEVDMSAEDAATLIMSAGVVQPGSDPQKKVAALAGMANGARANARLALQPAQVEVEATAPSPLRDGPERAPGNDDGFTRADQRDRLVALEQIEQAAQRLAALARKLRIVLHDAQRLVPRLRDQWPWTSERAMR